MSGVPQQKQVVNHKLKHLHSQMARNQGDNLSSGGMTSQQIRQQLII